MGRHGTIAGRKAAQDSKRAAIFTKYTRAIIVAAKNGSDMEYNSALKHAVDKAKAINMPNDNINKAIKKGAGEIDGANFESSSFEGYGAAGVAVIVETLSDNKNRTTSSIKHAFDKYGGNLGTPGCVSYMFNRKGLIIIEKTSDVEEDSLMEIALEAGMEDFVAYDDSFEIITSPEDFDPVLNAIREAGYDVLEADVEYVPSMEQTPTEEHDIKNLKKMINILEDDDDVQKVHHNCTIDLSE